MICILRNFNLVPEPHYGWDILPSKTDNSPGANLARIKFYRNDVSHPSNDGIDNTTFEKMWTDLRQVCL